MKTKQLISHLSLFGAATIWGLMAPIAKAAMSEGVSAIALASFRMTGAAICFWAISLFIKTEKVERHDYPKLFFASLLGIVFNQGFYTFGLSMTSPVDASIIITAMPIITLILAAVFLKEPITFMKAIGVILGFSGALLLVLSNSVGTSPDGNTIGNLLCLGASLSFACYLTIFKKLISKYSVFTLMKWMFLYATICFLPFSIPNIEEVIKAGHNIVVWGEILYVIVFGTFIAYILMVIGQQNLRPTVVSMYNYVQPIVSTSVSIIIGLAFLSWIKAVAALLIFSGVYAVTKSKSKAQ